MTEPVAAGVYKARCLRLLHEAQQTAKEIIVTKRGKPVARVSRVESAKPDWFGGREGTLRICGDIISSMKSGMPNAHPDLPLLLDTPRGVWTEFGLSPWTSA